MRRFCFIVLLGLIIILTTSYSGHVPHADDRFNTEVSENVIGLAELPVFYKPVNPVIARIPVVDEFDSKDIQLYIREQCHLVGLNYNFAVSLLREENPSFFKLAEGSTPQERVFNARNFNDNGSVDYGLWQLNGNFLWINFVPNFWHDLCDFDWTNPYHNSYIAVRHIKWLHTSLQRHNNEKGVPQTANSLYWETAMAYNAGLDTIRYGSRPSDKTLDYASRIIGRIF